MMMDLDTSVSGVYLGDASEFTISYPQLKALFEPTQAVLPVHERIPSGSPLEHQATSQAAAPDGELRFRKIECTFDVCMGQDAECLIYHGIPICRACIMRSAFTPKIIQEIHTDYNERCCTIRKQYTNFYNIGPGTSRARLLSKWLESGNNKIETLCFTHPPIHIGGSTLMSMVPRLKLQVEGCYDQDRHTQMRSMLQQLTVMGPNDVDSRPGDSTYHVLPPEMDYYLKSLPPIKTFLTWAQPDFRRSCETLPDKVENCLDLLFLKYVSHKLRLPYGDLVNDLLNTSLLARNYLMGNAPVEVLENDRLYAAHQYASINIGSHQQRKFADMSLPARTQLFVLAAQAFEVNEKRILERFERLVFHKNMSDSWQTSLGESPDPLILGLCIRRMALMYRQYMIYYKSHGSQKLTARCLRGRNMYDTMIRLYRHVFRNTLSPFHEDWRTEDHIHALGGNKAMVKAFQRLKVAEDRKSVV